MATITLTKQQIKTFFRKYYFYMVCFAVVLTFGWFVIAKLFSIESMVHSNHRLLLENQSWLQKQNLIANQLNRLETKLTACENILKANQVLAEDVKACRSQLDAMKTDVQQLQEHTTPAALALAFKQVNPSFCTTTKSQSETVHAENDKKTPLHNKKFLSSRRVNARRLPFQAINIDMWNGEPMVMVNHCGHTDLLAKQDTLAGWTLVDIEFDAGWVVFRNRQGQLVKSSLGG